MTALHLLTLAAVLPAALLFFVGGTALSITDWDTSSTTTGQTTTRAPR